MDLQSALERLYTDESLAADLDDQTAGPLLKWAEAQLPSILGRAEAQSADPEESFTAFRRLLKSVAQHVASSIEGETASNVERTEQIRALAAQLALNAPVEALILSRAKDGPSLVAQLAAVPVEAVTPPAASDEPAVPDQTTVTSPPEGEAPSSEIVEHHPSEDILTSMAPTDAQVPAETPAPTDGESHHGLFEMLRRAFDDARKSRTPDDKE